MKNDIGSVKLIKLNHRVNFEEMGKSPNCCNKLICIINFGKNVELSLIHEIGEL